MTQAREVGDDLFGEASEFDLGFLGSPLQQFEGGCLIDFVDRHQHALCVFNACTSLSDAHDRSGELVLACLLRRSYVDIEAVGSDDLILLVVQLVSYDDDVMNAALHIDNAVPAAERLTCLADEFEGVGDLSQIVGMLVGKHRFSPGTAHSLARFSSCEKLLSATCAIKNSPSGCRGGGFARAPFGRAVVAESGGGEPSSSWCRRAWAKDSPGSTGDRRPICTTPVGHPSPPHVTKPNMFSLI